MAGIQVVAVGNRFGKHEGEAVGYFDHKRVKVGQKFTIPSEQQFSEKWMEKLTSKESKIVEEEEQDRESDKRKNRKPVSVL